MISTSRRRFLGLSAGALGFSSLSSLAAAGANDRVRLGVIGCGIRGNALAGQFGELADVEIVAVSDPDTERMDRLVRKRGLASGRVGLFQDYRKLLERDDIDAVVVASPNHWHALHLIHACQAGKDVYVEKPVTHDLSQGARMLEAAAKYGRIVQAGTQNRSDTGLIDAFDFIRSGELGEIRAIHGLCFRNRESIGRLDAPRRPPATCDYDLWLGPAPDEPILRPQFHYDWNWMWATGDGDIGNQGPHEFDLITWLLGDPALPAAMRCFGNRFAWNDAGETPNLQAAWFELAGVPVVFEVNDLWLRPDLNASPSVKGIRVGVVVSCEGGEFRGGRGGGYVVGEDGRTKTHKFPGDAGGGHARNFIDAVKSRRAEDLRGDLGRAIQSSALAHLANLSLRAGGEAKGSALREELADSPALVELLERQHKQLAAWSVDPEVTPYRDGPEVAVDPESGRVLGPQKVAELATPRYREGWEMPEDV